MSENLKVESRCVLDVKTIFSGLYLQYTVMMPRDGWLATDGDGQVWFYTHKPTWFEEGNYWGYPDNQSNSAWECYHMRGVVIQMEDHEDSLVHFEKEKGNEATNTTREH